MVPNHQAEGLSHILWKIKFHGSSHHQPVIYDVKPITYAMMILRLSISYDDDKLIAMISEMDDLYRGTPILGNLHYDQ